MGVVRKVVNYLCDTLTPKVDGAIDHLPARFNGTFNDSTRNLTMVIESQGTSTENLTAVVNIPGGGGSGGPTYSAGNGINITSANTIEIDTAVTATKQSVDTLQAQVGDAFTEVAIGADGKSLDFTALDGQVNNIVLPSGGGSWTQITNQNYLNFNFKTGDAIFIQYITENHTVTFNSYIGDIPTIITNNNYNIYGVGYLYEFFNKEDRTYVGIMNKVNINASNLIFYGQKISGSVGQETFIFNYDSNLKIFTNANLN